MESIEGTLNESLEPKKSPESQMASHQVSEWWQSGDSQENYDRKSLNKLSMV